MTNLNAKVSELSKQNSALQSETNAPVLKVAFLEWKSNELSQKSADSNNLDDTATNPNKLPSHFTCTADPG